MHFFCVMGRAEGKEEGKGEAKSKRGLLKKGRRAFLLFVKSTSLTLGLSFILKDSDTFGGRLPLPNKYAQRRLV